MSCVFGIEQNCDECRMCGREKYKGNRITNADRIRSMTNEELSHFIYSIKTYDKGLVTTIENAVAVCSVSDVENWLESEVVT